MVHFPKQAWADAEAPRECLGKLPLIRKAGLGRDLLQGSSRLDKVARMVEPQGLDEARRCLAERLGKAAVEVAGRHAGTFREAGHIQTLGNMRNDPVKQCRKRGIRPGLGRQQGAELGLVAGPPRIQDQAPGNCVRHAVAKVARHERQAHVDTGRDAGRRPDPAILDVQCIGVDVQVRMAAAQNRSRFPMGGHAFAVYKSERGQHEGAGTDRAVAPRPGTRLNHPRAHRLVPRHGLQGLLVAADDQDRICRAGRQAR
jgi:hypothetical protein